MGQNILRHLREAGHDTLVVATQELEAPDEWVFEGTRVVRPTSRRTAFGHISDYRPDVVLTHHGETLYAVNYAGYFQTPVVQVVHNDMKPTDRYLEMGADYVIYNTFHLRDHYSHFNYPSSILHPPVYAEDHATTPGDHVTLINLNENKGAKIFYELAMRMPDVKFLAVEGGHGPQIFEAHPNVVFQQQTTDMKNDVWARTRILLTPSIYESYGMVAVEAMASGIPVIAHPTFGLKESLDYAGTFHDRDDLESWERTIRHLLEDKKAWKEKSEKALKRSAELNPETELENITRDLESLVSNGLRNAR